MPSRTDSSQDVTDQYGAAQRALADARALRTSLLKQLADATTTEQVDSLKAQIRDAEASISSDQATLNRLNQQVGFSQLSLQINARTVPTPVSHGSGGFGIGKAAHDAGRVLTVAAGVALIALAALTPIALLAALFWWVGSALRRRRREQALDVGLSSKRRSLPVWYAWRDVGEQRRHVALLGRVPVFSALSPDELERVAQVAVPRRFEAGEVVFKEGDEGSTCYIVRSGRARAIREHPDGRSITLAHFGPGRHLRRDGDVRRRAALGDGRDDRGDGGDRDPRARTCTGCCASTPTSR